MNTLGVEDVRGTSNEELLILGNDPNSTGGGVIVEDALYDVIYYEFRHLGLIFDKLIPLIGVNHMLLGSDIKVLENGSDLSSTNFFDTSVFLKFADVVVEVFNCDF